MKRVLISLMFVLLFVVGSCGEDGKDGSSCTVVDNDDGTATIKCDDGTEVTIGNTGDAGNTGNTGNTGNSGNSGNTGDTGNTGNSGDTGNTGNTGNSGNTGDTGNTRDTGNTGNSGDSGDAGATCTSSDKFCHSHDGLNWSDASSNKMTWNEAIPYCENLGGRLPTISELRTLIQNCPPTVTGGSCEVTDGCLSLDCWGDSCDGCAYEGSGGYSVFGDTSQFWSSSGLKGGTGNGWYVYFGYGRVSTEYWRINNGYARCVK
jgi:hypothetical protein